MDWFLIDRDFRHERVKGLQNNGNTSYQAYEIQKELKFYISNYYISINHELSENRGEH